MAEQDRKIANLQHTVGRLADVSIRSEGFRNLLSVVKKRGVTNKEFHTKVWPACVASLKDNVSIVEFKAQHGLGKAYAKSEESCKRAMAGVIDALRKAKLNESAAVFMGKGDLERNRDDQMQTAYQSIIEVMNLETKEKRDDAGLRTCWPTAEGFWYYGIENRQGVLVEPLVVGHNDLDQVECKVWILDEQIHSEYCRREEKMGSNRMLFSTRMMEIEDEAHMLALAERGTTKGAGKEDRQKEKGKGPGKGAGAMRGKGRGSSGSRQW